MFISTADGLFKSTANANHTNLTTPIQISADNLSDLQMGANEKMYGAIQGTSHLLEIGDPNNYSQPNITTLPLGFTNNSPSLPQWVTRNGYWPYIGITTPTFDDIAIIDNGTVNYQLPTTTTNGITGTWNPPTVIEGENTYTFTPNQGQWASSITMDFMLLLSKKLEANDDDFAFPHAPNQPPEVATTTSILNNDWGWETFGDVALSIVSISEAIPTIGLPILHQDGTITIPSRFWVSNAIDITYKITQNSCPSNFAIATVNLSSYYSNGTARKAPTTAKAKSDIIAFYPNPSKGIFNLDLTNGNESYNSIKVYNILGTSVYENRLNAKSFNEIDLTHVANGFYTARLISAENSTTIKLIKN